MTKVKLVNPNLHEHGIRLSDGIQERIVKPKSFTFVDENDVYYINSISRTFRAKHLIIDDAEINAALGYEPSIANKNDEEIAKLVKGNINTLKKELGVVSEKHLVARVMEIAKNITDLPKNKIQYFAEWSGYDMDFFVETPAE